MSWSSDGQQKEQVESWLKWTLGLLDQRNGILGSGQPVGQANKLAELSKARVTQKDLLPPLRDVWIAEGLLVWADRVEDFSVLLLDCSCFPHAKESGQAMLGLVEDLDHKVVFSNDETAQQVDSRFSEAIGIMEEGRREFYGELARALDDRLNAYLADKGLPRSATLPQEIITQVTQEAQTELLGRATEKTLQEIEDLYEMLWEVVKARRSEGLAMIASIVKAYGINPKRIGLA